jgi:uncharacterized protein (TIGR02145 family)
MRHKIVKLFAIILFNLGITDLQAQTVTDIDGNVYSTVTVGTQVWMKENLKTTKFNDNTAIPLVTDNTTWAALLTPAYTWYNNDAGTYKAAYGALYSWFTLDLAGNGGKNVCPTGWHVPAITEWATMETFLGGQGVAGGKLKETGTTHWLAPNTGATNESGFTAVPGGYRNYDGSFKNIGIAVYWWSSTEYSTNYAWYRMIAYDNGGLGLNKDNSKNTGFSIRCLRDLSTEIINPSTSIIKIYPNPVSGILTIEYKNAEFDFVNILNSVGILLKKENAITPLQQLDFSKYLSGLYILEFIKAAGNRVSYCIYVK